MREIAKTFIENGIITEEYTVQEGPNGDVVITCGVPEADVFAPDSFHIPASLRPWLAAAVTPAIVAKPAAHFETGIEFSVHAVRAFAQRAKTEMPHISAQAALHLIADILDGGSSAARQPASAKVIPIRGFAEGERVFLSDVNVIDIGGRARGFRP